MSWLFSLLLNNPIARAVGAALVGAAAILGYGAIKERGGRKDAQREAQEMDYEHAEDIRRNVRDNLDDELRKYDSAGYRED